MPEKNQLSKVIAKAWKDPAFKKKLLSDPKAALKEMGIEIQEGVVVRVVEDNSKTFTLLLPQAPTQIKEMSDKELEKISGGENVWQETVSLIVEATGHVVTQCVPNG